MSSSHAAEPTFAERLGWRATNVVVILHVDDMGMSHASNLGGIEAVEHGVATSWSVMMPCPWVPEITKYLKQHSDVDSGLHLTLTSEWELYRWAPLAGQAQVPGLVDPLGCLWRSVADVAAHASADEIEKEIRAQVDRARTAGLPITHLDSHMGTLFARADYFERLVRISTELQLPFLAVGGHATHAARENPEAITQFQPWIAKIWNAGLPLLDDLHTDSYGWPAAEKTERFLKVLAELKPGLTEILFHASRPTEEFPLITSSSEARRADLLALTDTRVRKLIQERGIILTTWKEVMARRKTAESMR